MAGMRIGGMRGGIERLRQRHGIDGDAGRGIQLSKIEQRRQHRRAQGRFGSAKFGGIGAFRRSNRQVELKVAVEAPGIDDRHAKLTQRDDPSIAPAPTGGASGRGHGEQCGSGSQSSSGSAHRVSVKGVQREPHPAPSSYNRWKTPCWDLPLLGFE